MCLAFVNLSRFDAVSAAIMVGRSVFGCSPSSIFVALSDAVSAAIVVGRSVFVCSAFVNFSLSGCDAVQVWERVNMAGAGEVKFFTCFVPSVLVVCFVRFFDCEHPHS